MDEPKSEQDLAQEIEIIDLPPSKEEVVEKAQTDTKTVRNELNWLQKSKERKDEEVSELENMKNKLEKDLAVLQENINEEKKKLGDSITKKVAALEVYKQIKITMTIMIVLLVAFIPSLASLTKSFNWLTTIAILVFIGAWGWHFVMNKKKMEMLKARYNL